jgi:hypothetical protein
MFLSHSTSWLTYCKATWSEVEWEEVVILITQWKDQQQLYCPLNVRMRRQLKMFDLSDYRSIEPWSISS